MILNPMPVVYRCYSADGDLLYVGFTVCFRQRVLQHRRRASWWSRVVRTVLQPVPDGSRGRQLEREFIRNLAPLHNKVDNRRRGWGYRAGVRGLGYFRAQDEFRSVVA